MCVSVCETHDMCVSVCDMCVSVCETHVSHKCLTHTHRGLAAGGNTLEAYLNIKREKD